MTTGSPALWRVQDHRGPAQAGPTGVLADRFQDYWTASVTAAVLGSIDRDQLTQTSGVIERVTTGLDLDNFAGGTEGSVMGEPGAGVWAFGNMGGIDGDCFDEGTRKSWGFSGVFLSYLTGSEIGVRLYMIAGHAVLHPDQPP